MQLVSFIDFIWGHHHNSPSILQRDICHHGRQRSQRCAHLRFEWSIFGQKIPPKPRRRDSSSGERLMATTLGSWRVYLSKCICVKIKWKHDSVVYIEYCCFDFSYFWFTFVSSVRSSSVYHGLLHTRSAAHPLFQIFQILQIRKWKWKWKDPTCAIFLKSMGFKDIEYDIPVYQM